MDRKEKTECMGLDGMRKSAGGIGGFYRISTEAWSQIKVKGGRACRLSSRYPKKYCTIQSKR